jgi:hypothetical protein
MCETTLSNADILLRATASPASAGGTVLTTTLPETTAVPGAVLPGSTDNIQTNLASVDNEPPAGQVDTKALLWVGAGIGTAWLLSRSGRSVSGAKGENWLVPALILGAGAAWYFFGDKVTAATSSPATTAAPAGGGGGGAQMDVASQQRVALITRYNDYPKQKSAIDAADDATIARWTLLTSMWDNGWTPEHIYGVGLDGITPASWNNSIGKWWENFSAANKFG